jgi:hypothetical protein
MSIPSQASFNVQLHQLMTESMGLLEFQTLCFYLDLDPDDFPPQGKSDKMRHLVVSMTRQKQLPRLLAALVEVRNDLREEVGYLQQWLTQTAAVDTTTVAPTPSPAKEIVVNPFGNRGRIEYNHDYLVRQPLTRHIFEELQKSVSLSIVGDSQSGKSSLLWYLTQAGPRELGRAAEEFVYFNMELVRHEDDFFENLCEELGLPHLRGMKLGRRLRGRRVVLCLDEIERMNYAGFGYDLRSELRGLSDGITAPFTLVIASRSPLGQLFPDSPELTSPLAGICKQENMPFFSLAECRELVKQKLADSLFTMPDAEVEHAWQQTHGHPGRFQEALRNSFARLYPSR